MQNYFNYFTEIEEQFQRRRGSLQMLSTLDWALIETWREAGVPLEAVLRGIDAAFDKYDARKGRTRVRRINGLAYCAQEVVAAVEDMKEASVGADAGTRSEQTNAGFEPERIAAHLEGCAGQIERAEISGLVAQVAGPVAEALRTLVTEVRANAPNHTPRLEDLERRLTVMEEKLLNAMMAGTAEDELLALREESTTQLAPYRSRMQTAQIRQVEHQFLHKRLMEKYGLPRLSLFYMNQT